MAPAQPHEPATADARCSGLTPGRRLRTRVAGVFLFLPLLARLGFDTGRSETPITPVMMGDPDTAGRFSQGLFDEGVFAQPVVFPTVAIDKARIRTIVTAAHSAEQLDQALEAFAAVGRDLGLIAG